MRSAWESRFLRAASSVRLDMPSRYGDSEG
jgi:hypothetical protein